MLMQEGVDPDDLDLVDLVDLDVLDLLDHDVLATGATWPTRFSYRAY